MRTLNSGIISRKSPFRFLLGVGVGWGDFLAILTPELIFGEEGFRCITPFIQDVLGARWRTDSISPAS